jgi:mono/diheme cytochrome c family protein
MSKRTGAVLVAGVAFLVAIAWLLPNWAQNRRAQDRAMAAEFYQGRCAMCHEVEGGIGPRLDARVLASYGNAQLLFNYVRLAMPYGAPRTLSNEEYWWTVAHLLRSRGLVAEDAIVSQETAEGIVLEGGAS